MTQALALRERGTPVGSFPADRSWVGAVDMTGGVREWTSTVFDRELVVKLDARLRAGSIEGWDPGESSPVAGVARELPPGSKAHELMCIRGGANGEVAPLPAIGVRRTGESSTPYADVGFRLVLVPRGGVR